MTAAYATIANGGIYIEPKLYTKVEDIDGNKILEKETKTRQVMSKQTAYIMTNLMQAVVQSGGTATYARLSNIDVAAKTGTTNDSKDRYFAEFTPYYVATVWYGYDNPQRITESGTNPAGKICDKIMEKIHANLAAAKFEVPDGLNRITICKDSGLLPTDGCETTTEYFLPGTGPTESCTLNTKVTICKDSGLLANEFCPADSREEKIYINKSTVVSGSSSEDGEKNDISSMPTEYCTIHKKQETSIVIENPVINNEVSNNVTNNESSNANTVANEVTNTIANEIISNTQGNSGNTNVTNAENNIIPDVNTKPSGSNGDENISNTIN